MVIRKNYWGALPIGLTVCFSFCAQHCFSQTIQTFTDRKDILIGEPVTLKIKAVFPEGKSLLKSWFFLPDSIPHFDIVETGRMDTIINKDNSKAFEQTITFTSFDSGKWVFPSLAAEFSDVTGLTLQKFQTDSSLINVSYSPPDSTNQLRDIKPIIKVSIRDDTLFYIISAIVLLLIIILLLTRYWKKKRKIKPEGAVSNLSPYDEAMGGIADLVKYNLVNADELKIYHTKLSVIYKNYLGRKQGKNLFNKTTGDLLMGMTENSMTANDVSNLATALRCSDAVKFAKYLPSPKESEDCKQKIKETINLTEASKH